MKSADQEIYPFADLTLDQRLEQSEALANVDFVKGRALAFPESGAEWTEVGGAYAMFDGPTSPVTQTFGLGMFQPTTDALLDQIENFFHARGAEVFHEVCPLADSSVASLLNQRSYYAIEFSNVLYQPIRPDLSLAAKHNEAIEIRPIRTDEHEAWAETAALGWSEFEGVGDFIRELGKINARRSALCFVAELNGKSIATGTMNIGNGVAILAGASTIPEGRRQGAQLALLEFRLRYAAEQGCDIALIATLPGSASQRNAERHGFRIAYTRTKWRQPAV